MSATSRKNKQPSNENPPPEPSGGHPGVSKALIAVAYGLPLLAAGVLYALNVPFGRPDVIVYRYSPMVVARLTAAAIVLVVFVPAILALAAGTIRTRLTHGQALLTTLVLITALGLWTFWAPPYATEQHFFNFLSPSQDGAFVMETRRIDDTAAYLAEFESILQRTPEQMKGTRVLSNPPGATVLALQVDALLVRFPGLKRRLLGMHVGDLPVDSPEGDTFATAMGLAIVLHAMWILSAIPLYRLAAIWFDPLPALVLTLICVFNPATVAFSPGKDPAQLLTVATAMWGWMAAHHRGRTWPAVVSGVALMLGLTIGLVHVWIGLILLAATVWAAARDRSALGRLFLRVAMPAAGGMALVCILAWLLWRWNIIATVFQVASSFSRVADQLSSLPPTWLLLQVPMFAVFAGGGIWLLAIGVARARERDTTAALGRNLVICTLLVMAYSAFYTVLETPRLWIVFVPMLVMGMAMMWPATRRSAARRGVALLVVAALQVACTCVQWSLFDARESEMRLTTGRLFD